MVLRLAMMWLSVCSVARGVDVASLSSSIHVVEFDNGLVLAVVCVSLCVSPPAPQLFQCVQCQLHSFTERGGPVGGMMSVWEWLVVFVATPAHKLGAAPLKGVASCDWCSYSR